MPFSVGIRGILPFCEETPHVANYLCGISFTILALYLRSLCLTVSPVCPGSTKQGAIDVTSTALLGPWLRQHGSWLRIRSDSQHCSSVCPLRIPRCSGTTFSFDEVYHTYSMFSITSVAPQIHATTGPFFTFYLIVRFQIQHRHLVTSQLVHGFFWKQTAVWPTTVTDGLVYLFHEDAFSNLLKVKFPALK